MTNLIDMSTDILTDIIDDIIDTFNSINHSLISRTHWRPALGLRFDFTTRSYFVAEISLIFYSLRLELWTWEA